MELRLLKGFEISIDLLEDFLVLLFAIYLAVVFLFIDILRVTWVTVLENIFKILGLNTKKYRFRGLEC